jgi:hypothetical protein
MDLTSGRGNQLDMHVCPTEIEFGRAPSFPNVPIFRKNTGKDSYSTSQSKFDTR